MGLTIWTVIKEIIFNEIDLIKEVYRFYGVNYINKYSYFRQITQNPTILIHKKNLI